MQQFNILQLSFWFVAFQINPGDKLNNGPHMECLRPGQVVNRTQVGKYLVKLISKQVKNWKTYIKFTTGIVSEYSRGRHWKNSEMSDRNFDVPGDVDDEITIIRFILMKVSHVKNKYILIFIVAWKSAWKFRGVVRALTTPRADKDPIPPSGPLNLRAGKGTFSPWGREKYDRAGT